DLCLVAAGALDGFFEYELAPWDFAAGRLIVTEAGGRLSDCRGESLPLERTSILATNGRVHEAALAVVQRHLPG
ncbi:MAG: inositol monophosphatase, partial [Planctomycetales bacterium]|nr:inositol monophosphatase [Planctomycetales bacterium]